MELACYVIRGGTNNFQFVKPYRRRIKKNTSPAIPEGNLLRIRGRKSTAFFDTKRNQFFLKSQGIEHLIRTSTFN